MSLQRFMNANPPSEVTARWKEFESSELPSVGEGEMPENFIPFFGTPRFGRLSGEEKRRLYLSFIQLNAEGTVLFERLLLFAFRKNPGILRDPLGRASLRKLLREELLHARAFRAFLRGEPSFSWPASYLMTGNRLLVHALCRVTAAAPLALLPWGVKIEAYSMTYGHALRKALGSWDRNRWSKLHQLHVIDEAFHIPLQLDLYNGGFSLSRPFSALKTLGAFFVLIFLMQCLLVSGSYQMIRASFPDITGLRGGLKRIRLVFALARWNVRQFEAYRQALARVRAVYKEKKPRLGPLYSILYW